MKTLLMAFFYLTLMAYPAKAPVYSPSPFDLVFGHCGIRDPCFIDPNDGGQVYLFVQAARAVNRGEKKPGVINNGCPSAFAPFFCPGARGGNRSRKTLFIHHPARPSALAVFGSLAGGGCWLPKGFLSPRFTA